MKPRLEALCHIPGKEGREESEEEREKRKAGQQMGLPGPGGSNEGLSASHMFGPARIRGAIGESGRSGNCNAPYDPKRSFLDLHVESANQWKRMQSCENREWRWEERGFWQEKEMTQRPFGEFRILEVREVEEEEANEKEKEGRRSTEKGDGGKSAKSLSEVCP